MNLPQILPVSHTLPMFQIECTYSSVAVISIWWLILFSSSCQKVRVQGFHRHLGKSWQNIVSNPRRTLTFSAWGIQSIHSVPFSFPSDIDPSAPRQSCAVSLPKELSLTPHWAFFFYTVKNVNPLIHWSTLYGMVAWHLTQSSPHLMCPPAPSVQGHTVYDSCYLHFLLRQQRQNKSRQCVSSHDALGHTLK